MADRYFITADQFESIQHYCRMFELQAEQVSDLCRCEKDDIVYGYELGKMHSHQRDCFMEMLEIISAIKEANK